MHACAYADVCTMMMYVRWCTYVCTQMKLMYDDDAGDGKDVPHMPIHI